MKKENKRGFTIIEGLIAVVILVLMIMVAFNITRSVFKPLSYAKAQITASFLAQEAMETTRYIRDNNLKRNRDWLDGLGPCLDVCDVSVLSDPKVIDCTSGSGCTNLRYEASTGLYGYNPSWEETVFIREIKIIEDEEKNVIVSVKVKWPGGEVNVGEVLYNFK